MCVGNIFSLMISCKLPAEPQLQLMLPFFKSDDNQQNMELGSTDPGFHTHLL